MSEEQMTQSDAQPAQSDSQSTQQAEPPRPTLKDPVDAETLKRFEAIQNHRAQLGIHLLDLEREKMRVLRTAAEVEAEQRRLFETVLTVRGVPPGQPVEIDVNTGLIHLRQPPQSTETAPSAEAPSA